MGHRTHGSLPDLPSHVLALVLRDASPLDLVRVAHVCRALHAHMTGQERCVCTSAPCVDVVMQHHHARAFWVHWRDARPGTWQLVYWAPFIEQGCAAMVHFALLADSDCADDLLHEACRSGNLAAVERVLREAHAEPSSHAAKALDMACFGGHLPIVECLLRDARVNPAHGEQRALQRACACDHLAVVVRLLRDPRVDPSAKRCAALHNACIFGCTAIVQRLLDDPRVDPMIDRGAFLMISCNQGYDDVVALFLAHERVVITPDILEYALLAARDAGHDEIIALLEGHVG